ncbi:cytochrome P450 3A14-like [Ruditapes philippinarum]|uniref:cytochrome P450 3A14-like n=1 Tax=Ruditapes philippinarum TaxID=129788 RepID=UPI00295A5EB1|nr:cytochrome P450 3A14-like [Ruditapes philippinarum]
MEVFGVSLSLWTVVTTVLLLWIISVIYEWLSHLAWRRKYKLRGDFPLPLVGNLFSVTGQKWEKVDDKMLEKYGPVSVITFGKFTTINVSDTGLLKKIFIKDHLNFQNRFTAESLDTWPMNQTLIALKGDQWKRVRHIVTPTFSTGKIKMMVKEMNYCAGLLTTGLMEKAKAGESIDSRKHFGCYTMDVIAGTAFGIRTDSYNNPDEQFVSLAQQVFGQSALNPLIMFAVFFPRIGSFMVQWLGVCLFYSKKALSFFTDVIKAIINERQEKGDTGRTDMLQLMMNANFEVGTEETKENSQSGKKLLLDELLGMGIVVFAAGYETTALLLTYLSYILATHPDVQDKLLKEVDQHFPSDDTEVRYDVVMEMPYLDQVICETLRMYPPVNKMNRVASKNDIEIDGHWFPQDTIIGFSIWQVHHSLGYYPEPEQFKPERFTHEEKAKRDPFVFMPFGHGPRNCIGMRLALLEAKIATVSVLRKLKFVKCPETAEHLDLIKETFMKPKNPVKVGVVVR